MATAKHRIGKDLLVRWAFHNPEGGAFGLTGLDLRIFLLDYFQRRVEVTDYILESDNVLVFTFAGTAQKVTGPYTLQAWVNKDKVGQSVVDACQCFELVSCTHMESDMGAEGPGTDYTDVVSTIQVGVEGKSAYASWVSAGHKGTEEDFVAWLRQPAVDAAAVAQEYNEHQPIIGSNGNWWVWDADSDAYIDSGNPARGDVCYPTFSVNDNMEVVVHKPSALPDGLFRMEDGNLILRV